MCIWLVVNAVLFAVYSRAPYPGEFTSAAESMAVSGKPAKAIIASTFLFVATYAPTWGPVSWTYPPELYPLRLRGKAVALATSANWAFNFALAYFVPPAFEKIRWKVYVLFAVFCATMFIHVLLLFPETANKTIEEVEGIFDDSKDGGKSLPLSQVFLLSSSCWTELALTHAHSNQVHWHACLEDKKQPRRHDEYRAARRFRTRRGTRTCARATRDYPAGETFTKTLTSSNGFLPSLFCFGRGSSYIGCLAPPSNRVGLWNYRLDFFCFAKLGGWIAMRWMLAASALGSVGGCLAVMCLLDTAGVFSFVFSASIHSEH